MTYNIKGARNHADGLEALARVIEAAAPDVIGLQEVDNLASRSGRVDQTSWLAERLGMKGRIFGASLAFEDGGEFGNALLSQYPIVASTVKSLYQPPGQRRPVAAASPDTWWNMDEPRSILNSLIDVAGTQVAVFVTHLGLSPEQRLRQAGEVLHFTSEWRPGTPMILLGDFNATPDSPEIAALGIDLRDASAGEPAELRPTRHSEPTESRGGRGWSACLDYVFTSPDIPVENALVWRDETEASDHKPVLVMLRI